MVQTFNKQIVYNDYHFNIKVECKIMMKGTEDYGYRVTINHTGPNNFIKEAECKMETSIENTINFMIADAKQWVDNLRNYGKPSHQILLESLGFNQ